MLIRLIVKTFILSAFCFTSQHTLANKKLTENYISEYKKIAISEMHRTGIPASIKLAQAILESDLGRSPLAYKANNHFGIKCGNGWTGETYYKQDDETDNTGILIESCFRSFNSGEESYLAHSDFLTSPSKQSRYGFLFNLNTTDYVGWANGLKFAGYASDPSYPSKLIKIIESYQLYKLDVSVNTSGRQQDLAEIPAPKEKFKQDKYKKDTPEKVNPNIWNSDETPETEGREKNMISGKYKVAKINDVKMVLAYGGESIKELALRNGKNVFDLLEYNELVISQDQVLKSNEVIFLSKKKKSVEDEALAFHTVSKGETLYVIAQKNGIRLENLMSKNNIPPDAEPLQGEVLSLNKNLSKRDSPKYRLVERTDVFVDFGSLQ